MRVNGAAAHPAPRRDRRRRRRCSGSPERLPLPHPPDRAVTHPGAAPPQADPAGAGLGLATRRRTYPRRGAPLPSHQPPGGSLHSAPFVVVTGGSQRGAAPPMGCSVVSVEPWSGPRPGRQVGRPAGSPTAAPCNALGGAGGGAQGPPAAAPAPPLSSRRRAPGPLYHPARVGAPVGERVPTWSLKIRKRRRGPQQKGKPRTHLAEGGMPGGPPARQLRLVNGSHLR